MDTIEDRALSNTPEAIDRRIFEETANERIFAQCARIVQMTEQMPYRCIERGASRHDESFAVTACGPGAPVCASYFFNA